MASLGLNEYLLEQCVLNQVESAESSGTGSGACCLCDGQPAHHTVLSACKQQCRGLVLPTCALDQIRIVSGSQPDGELACTVSGVADWLASGRHHARVAHAQRQQTRGLRDQGYFYTAVEWLSWLMSCTNLFVSGVVSTMQIYTFMLNRVVLICLAPGLWQWWRQSSVCSVLPG